MKTSDVVQKAVLGKTWPNKTTLKERTQLFLATWRGEQLEWGALWGVMTLSNAWTTGDRDRLEKLIDTQAVAARIDDLIAEMRADAKTFADEKLSQWQAERGV